MFEIDRFLERTECADILQRQTDQVNPKDMSDLLFILPIKVLQS